MNTVTPEQNTLCVISILKQNGVKKVVISPGNTNTAFVSSIQNDNNFELYSCVDERSAAYMACGLAEASGEVVVLSCTGATASRNYHPGLTEAFYKNLPILALTSSQQYSRIGHLNPQAINRSNMPLDCVAFSERLPVVKDNEDLFDCTIKVNRAIAKLISKKPKPVHLDLPTTFSLPFVEDKGQNYRKITVVNSSDEYPDLSGTVGIFCGSSRRIDESLTQKIDTFCETYNSLVFCDHTSGYFGKYRVDSAILFGQEAVSHRSHTPKILVHFGEITGEYYTLGLKPAEVWRVDHDAEIQDTFRKLKYVFSGTLDNFFDKFNLKSTNTKSLTYFDALHAKEHNLRDQIPELPFSNIWSARELSKLLPFNSNIHFGILNSLRSWNFFNLDNSINRFCNVGGFGIDGTLSTAIGASLISKERLNFVVLGDLAFFYDLNVLGNRHVGSNLRIILINNGEGTEFKTYKHHATYFGAETSEFISAKGHNAQKSRTIVKDFVTNLGFEYFAAENKIEFKNIVQDFVTTNGKSKVLEIFTESVDEAEALKIIRSLDVDYVDVTMQKIKKIARGNSTLKYLNSKVKSKR